MNKRNVIIVHMPRSASHALMYAIADSGLGSIDHEMMTNHFFNGWFSKTRNEMIGRIRRVIEDQSTVRGIVVKLQPEWFDFACSQALIPVEERIEIFKNIFDEFEVIYLTRHDLVSVAVSSFVSHVSKVWQPKEGTISISRESYDLSSIVAHYRWAVRSRRLIDKMMTEISGTHVCYNDLMKDPGIVEDLIGFDMSRIRNRVDMMKNNVKDEMVTRFRNDLANIDQSILML